MIDALKRRCIVSGECWIWQGAKDGKGYGFKRFNGTLWKAHRLMYYVFNGEHPKEKQVCHTCDTPSCVNPKHLWLGTNQENQIDAVIKKRNFNTKKTRCKNGHDYSLENTMVMRTGERVCKTCSYARSRKWKQARPRSERT